MFLSYYRARYYDPAIGRFLTEDPTRLSGSGPNFYEYVGNNATDWSDPTGLCDPSNDIKECLQAVFNSPIDKIRIEEKVKGPDYQWDATTRKNKITIFVPCDVFFRDPDTYLEEYYHVIEQWNKGRVSILGWLWAERHSYDNNKYEIEAKEWVKHHMKDFQDCMKCKSQPK